MTTPAGIAKSRRLFELCSDCFIVSEGDNEEESDGIVGRAFDDADAVEYLTPI